LKAKLKNHDFGKGACEVHKSSNKGRMRFDDCGSNESIGEASGIGGSDKIAGSLIIGILNSDSRLNQKSTGKG